MTYFVGLDLGQASDYTALAVVERQEQPSDALFPLPPRYAVLHLRRWALGTPYTGIVADVATLLDRHPLPGCVLTVDATGVGRAVVDAFRVALADRSSRPQPPARLVPITITAGFHARPEAQGWHVPKRDLAGVLSVLLGERRFAIANLPERSALLKELRMFKVKVTAAGNETFEAWRERDHDDMVFAVALPTWYAERADRPAPTLRVFALRDLRGKSRQVEVAACSRADLARLELGDRRPVIIWLAGGQPEKVPDAPLLMLSFPDTDPAEGAAECMDKRHGKQLWRFLVQRQSTPADTVLVVGDGNRLARSVAKGIADTLRLGKVRAPSDGPLNPHVVETVRDSRGLVCGEFGGG